MEWVYRLQQRIALTRSECTVILVLAFLCSLGLTVRYIQSRAQPLPAVDYAEADHLFQEASEASTDEVAEQAQPDPALGSTTEPSAQDATYASKPAPSAAAIHINTAGVSELQRLPRIGPKMAARIIAYREAHGPFRRVQDLVRVRGIGAKTLEGLTPYLIIEEQE